jgi:hypothetical protein
MRNLYFFRLFFCFVFSFVSLIFVYANESRYPNYEQFANLSLKEQKKVLERAFIERTEHSKNIHYCLEWSISYPKLSTTDKPDFRKLIRTVDEFKSYSYVFEHWVRNETYRMVTEQFDKDKNLLIHRITDVFDQAKGVRKAAQIYCAEKQSPTGRVDTVHNPILQLNSYLKWIGGMSGDLHPKSFYMFIDLLEHRDKWIIETNKDSRLVRLTTIYPPHLKYKQYEGKRRLLLDPMKGFMPVDGEFTWHSADDNGYENWEEGCFIVEDSKLVGNVWMPTLMIKYFRTKVTAHKFTLIKMKITDIEHGQVTNEDIVFKFPEDTRVVDAIQGVSYKTDANGEPIESTIQPLYGLDPSQVKLPEKKLGKANYVLIVIGLLLILTAIYLMFHKNKKAS